MSLQLPAILSPPTPCIPSPALTVSPLEEVAEVALPFTGRRPVLGFAHPTQARQCTRPYRVQHCFIYGLQFVSGCFPPRLSTTQLPSTTDSRCSVRWGLPPHCWCALSGARRTAARRFELGCRHGTQHPTGPSRSVGRRPPRACACSSRYGGHPQHRGPAGGRGQRDPER